MTLNECPVCAHTNFHSIYSVKDHLVTQEIFTIVECPTCGLRLTNPRPEDHALSTYYDSDQYISHTNEAQGIVDNLYKLARVYTLRSKRRLIERITTTKGLLDIGCGTGHFIRHCADHGWNVTGVEPDDKAREMATTGYSFSVYQDINDLEEEKFAIITLWHVLEHLPDLNVTLQKLKSLLLPDGKIIIAVPNYPAYEERKFKEEWAAYDVPRHLYHFNQKSMKKLIDKHGMKVDRIHPMKLDSYYISLLSNQHKYGAKKLLNSFITGLLSNIYAIKNKNYSSLIYQVSVNE